MDRNRRSEAEDQKQKIRGGRSTGGIADALSDTGSWSLAYRQHGGAL